MKQGLENRKRCIHGAILFLIAVMALILGADSGWAKPQQNSLHAKLPTAPGRLDTLGKVSFPTSCSPRVQSQIEEGVALLHSFQYWQAESRFAEVIQAGTAMPFGQKTRRAAAPRINLTSSTGS